MIQLKHRNTGIEGVVTTSELSHQFCEKLRCHSGRGWVLNSWPNGLDAPMLLCMSQVCYVPPFVSAVRL